MSVYTTQIKNIVESYTSSMQGQPITDRITAALPSIFDFDFPIFEESHRTELERKIIMHYLNKEIGLETVGLWKLYLNERLNLIMPYYNNLYEIESRKIDFLTNEDKTESFSNTRKLNREGTNNLTRNDTDNVTRKNTQEDNANTTQNDKSDTTSKNNHNETSKTLGSDLPQTNYAGVDYGTNLTESTVTSNDNGSVGNTTNSTTIVAGKTAINGTDNRTLNSTEKGQTKGNESEVSSYERKSSGYSGENPTKLMLDYRNSIINIDKMIVDELSDLFMLIY